jgi:hypothetical protein
MKYAEREGRTPEFRAELAWLAPQVLLVEYAGILAGDAPVARELEARLESAPGRIGLCYDLTHFVSFDRAQVAAHAQAYTRLHGRVAGAALVGAGPQARFAAVTVGLVARIPVQSFDGRAEAVAWLEKQLGAPRRRFS